MIIADYLLILVITLSGINFEFQLGNTHTSLVRCDEQADELVQALAPAATQWVQVRAYCTTTKR